MTKKEFSVLKAGDKIIHRTFGECIVGEIKYACGGFFGLVLLPNNDEGKHLLYRLTGTPLGTPLLEGSLRLVKPVKGGEDVK